MNRGCLIGMGFKLTTMQQDTVTEPAFCSLANQKSILILDGISRGERAIVEGRVFTQAEAKLKMVKWLKGS